MADNSSAAATQDAPDTQDTSAPPSPSDSGADSAAGEAGLSEDLQKRYDALQDQPDFFEPENEVDPQDENPEPAPEPEPEEAPRRGRERAEPRTTTEAVAGTFDTEGLVKDMVEEMGDSAKPVANRIGAAFNALESRIDQLTEQLEAVLEENKKLTEGIEPVRKNVERWSKREQEVEAQSRAKSANEAHAVFDSLEGFADRYGKGDRRSHSETNRNWRMTIYHRALQLQDVARAANMPLSVKEAVLMAHHERLGGRGPSKEGAIKQVQDGVRRTQRGLSIDPGRAGGKPGKPATPDPEAERAEKIRTVEAIVSGRK